MKNKKDSYPNTKKILKIAIEHGFTQQEIAVKAGLSIKSTALVSRWVNGKALATKRQLQYFINEYGYLLKARSTHLFYGFVKDNEGKRCIDFEQLHGDVFLKYLIKIDDKETKKKRSVLRLIVIQNENRFHLLKQVRAGYNSRSYPNPFINAFTSDNEEANWYFYHIDKNLEHKELSQSIERYTDELTSGDNPSDQKFDTNIVNPLLFTYQQKLIKSGILDFKEDYSDD